MNCPDSPLPWKLGVGVLSDCAQKWSVSVNCCCQSRYSIESGLSAASKEKPLFMLNNLGEERNWSLSRIQSIGGHSVMAFVVIFYFLRESGGWVWLGPVLFLLTKENKD
jgi:hypothetical protein